MLFRLQRCLLLAAIMLLFAETAVQAADRLVLEPKGESRGHIVLVSGDEEYRSEEVMPMVAANKEAMTNPIMPVGSTSSINHP